MSVYKPVTVAMAKQLAEDCNKDQIIIIGWSNEHQLFHTATYGVSAADKVAAAHAGEDAAAAAGGGLFNVAIKYEDFRDEYDAGQARCMFEAIQRTIATLKEIDGYESRRTIEEAAQTIIADLTRAIQPGPQVGRAALQGRDDAGQ